jgi:hypothetical protein
MKKLFVLTAIVLVVLVAFAWTPQNTAFDPTQFDTSVFGHVTIKQGVLLTNGTFSGNGSGLTNLNDTSFTTNYSLSSSIPVSLNIAFNNAATGLLWSNEVQMFTPNFGLLGPGYPNNLFLVVTNLENGVSGSFNSGMALLTDAQNIEFYSKGGVSQVWIDDYYQGAQTVQLPNDGNLYYVHLTFPTSRQRKISWYGNMPFGQIFIPTTNSISHIPLTQSPALTVSILGDSFSEDAGLNEGGGFWWPSWLFKLVPTVSFVNESQGGTGFLNPGTAGHLAFSNRLAFIEGFNPDYVIVAGGRNDGGYPSNTLYNAVQQVLTNLQQTLPNTKIGVLNEIASDNTSDYRMVSNILTFACSDAGGTNGRIWLINNLAEPWITGNIGTPNSGNANRYIDSDTVHYNTIGQEFFGRRIIAAMQLNWPELRLLSRRYDLEGMQPVSFTFPNTTVNWTNPLNTAIQVYIDNAGVTGTLIKKNGLQIFSGLVSDVQINLRPGEYFSETYTVGTPVGHYSPFP